jgi:hypothetical protein
MIDKLDMFIALAAERHFGRAAEVQRLLARLQDQAIGSDDLDYLLDKLGRLSQDNSRSMATEFTLHAVSA